jgi:hypothetical protein
MTIAGQNYLECTGCHERKSLSNFVGELCGACFGAGVSFPDQSERKEEPMAQGVSEKTPCTKGCGMLLMAQHRARHEAICDGTPRPAKLPRSDKAPPAKKVASKTKSHPNGSCADAIKERQATILRLQQEIDALETAVRILGGTW